MPQNSWPKLFASILVSLVFLNPPLTLPPLIWKNTDELLEILYNLSCDGMISLEYKQKERPLGDINSSW